MNEADRIDKALQLENLALPAKARVVRLDWDLYEDSSGQDSLKVWVILDDQTTDKEIEHAPIHEVKSKVIESLEQHGITLFPYFFFARESEHKALVGEG